MRFLRRKFLLRSFSVFSLLLVLNNIIYPNISYALTTGPHQPEFTSYEEPSASDMVNLSTGDFTFNMPVLSVPIGEDGAFTLPLSYHAGIGPDQESSWIGLGWNVNVGSVTRSINGFPDDASSESQTVTVQDLTGQKGWSSSFLGSTIGWDFQKGHYGVIDLSLGAGGLSVGYDDTGINSIGMSGFSFSGKGGFNFDASKFMINVVSTALMVATAGTGEAATNGALQSAMNIGLPLAMDALMPSATPSAGTNGYWAYTKETKKRLFHTDYWIWLDQTRVEDMYGVLNLDKAVSDPNVDWGSFLKISKNVNGGGLTYMDRFTPSGTTFNQGAASDINTDLSATTNYQDNVSPALLAYDNFSVNGPGISGGIKPYRMEIGSVSVPREMTTNHVRLNPIKYMDYTSPGTRNKVPFVYEGATGNAYYNHVGASSGSVTSPAFNFGVNSVKTISATGTPGPNTNFLEYDLYDVILDNQRIGSNATASKKLAQGHFIEWLTNKETNISTCYSNTAYMDYYKPADRSTVRSKFGFGGSKVFTTSTIDTNGKMTFNESTAMVAVNDILDITVTKYDYTNDLNNPVVTVYHPYAYTVTGSGSNTNGTYHITCSKLSGYYNTSNIYYSFWVATRNPSIIPDNTIGGFVITDPSGMNYHFSIPVYDYNLHTETVKKSDATKRNMVTRHAPFANTWLLTAITGPDFVDRGGANNSGDGYIDENDWGYWVKFNYNRAGANFQWALPYNKQKATSDDNYYTYSSGIKEKYFLSTIETRSHVALFLQASRQDGLDATGTIPSPRLSEIDLITKDTYKTLLSKYKMPDASGTRSVAYNASNFSTYLNNFTRASALKRIVFNQDYSLCNGVPTSSSGKLTLKSLSICGSYDSTANNANKVFPDYKFDYANNPSYDANKWDGWGLYSSQATASGLTHQASRNDADGYAWSLTKVTNPEGSEIQVTYERDTYTSISGQPFPSTDNTTISGTVSAALVSSNSYPVSSFGSSDVTKLRIGDVINLSGTISYTCPGGSLTTTGFSTTGTIYSIIGNLVMMSQPFATANCSGGASNLTVSVSGSAAPALKKGGNIRVSSLTLNDPSGVSYKTLYQYANGTVSIEPDYIKSQDLSFYNYLNYSSTPVLYGQVTVLTGKLSSSADFNTKQVYNFITPNTSQYSINTVKVRDKAILSNYGPWIDYSTVVKHEITRHTSQIGKITSEATYDNAGALYAQKNYYYTESPTNGGVNNYQGIFSEGTLLFEAVNDGGAARYHRGQRTTCLSYPYTLQRVETITDGFKTVNENKDWDFMTGSVLETRTTSPLGLVTQTITVPAYKKTPYSELDSKAKDPSYKNMLTQQAAKYIYRLDINGNQTGLLSASATTWKKDWSNYRILDVNSNYINDPDQSVSPVWRANQDFVWKGTYSRKQTDGTQSFSSADQFNFNSVGSNTNWQMVGSKERYTHNSTLLETKDMNGIYSSSKRGYSDQYTIASASNGRYEEIAYSGAEDALSSSYFGGEVSLGSGQVVSTSKHTGAKALSLSSGYGFVFKSTGLLPNKTYRASVWTNSVDGRLYYKLNGGGEVLSSAPTTLTKAGNWYKVDMLIPIGSSFTSLEVGVKSNTGATIIFDDFRFQPVQSAMTTYVFDPVTRNLTHAHDNDNMYTRYEYNGRGLLIKTYSESFKYGGVNGEKLVLEKKSDYKRFYTNQ